MFSKFKARGIKIPALKININNNKLPLAVQKLN